MRVVVFGVGKFYINRREDFISLCSEDSIVAFLDNKFVTETIFDNVPAMNPRNIDCIEFDRIVIMTVHIGAIYDQLCNLGVPVEKIYTWKQFRSEKTGGSIEECPTMLPCTGKKILLVSNPIRYDGGSMTAIYAAIAMRSIGYCVWIIAGFVESELKKRLLSEGVNVAICEDIPYIGWHIKTWIDSFSIVLVNVFPNIHSVCELSKFKPVMWWLHESDVYGKVYQKTFDNFPWYRECLNINTVNVVAVSNKAMENFQRYYPNIDVRVMPYGLPDEIIDSKVNHKKMIFAIIGYVSYLKGQDVFLNAAKKIIDDEVGRAEFWIIGNTRDNYAKELLAELLDDDYIKVKGEVNRTEMKMLLSEIDVVVSASREDSLPIVITEGMMNSKVCIVSDAIGSVKYIRNMENGIIFKTQDAVDLADKIRWCLHNKSELEKIGRKARKTYEEVFSMSVFAERLKKEISYAETKFEKTNLVRDLLTKT